MLIRLYHQYLDGRQDPVAQHEVDLDEIDRANTDAHEWLAEQQRRHPCPEDACWVMENDAACHLRHIKLENLHVIDA